MLRDEEWYQEDGLMLKEGKVYVPRDEKLRAEVIRLHHDMPVSQMVTYLVCDWLKRVSQSLIAG